MPTLTAEQSKAGWKRSAEVRRANAIELQRLRERVKEFESALPAQPTPEPKQTLPELVIRTREHIDAIDKLIDDCTDAREMDALTRSREREWRIYAHLANLPGPGNLKPASPRSRSTQAPPIPQPVVVQPVVQPKSGASGSDSNVGK